MQDNILYLLYTVGALGHGGGGGIRPAPLANIKFSLVTQPPINARMCLYTEGAGSSSIMDYNASPLYLHMPAPAEGLLSHKQQGIM